MSTQKQKKLAQAMVDNLQSDKPLTGGELLENVGYATNTAEAKPGEIMSQPGVIEELAKLGFDEQNAKRVVGEILNSGEDKDRLKAADLVFKVQGSYAPEKKSLTGVITNVSPLPEVLEAVNEELKRRELEE